MSNHITDSAADAADMVKAEQGEMKDVIDGFDKSQADETRQASAYKVLMELKKIRNKKRKN